MGIFNEGLVFKLNNNLFTFNSDEVVKILRVPSVTKIPLSHHSIRGISAIEGNIVTIIDLNRILSNSTVSTDINNENARAITIKDGDTYYSFLVDEVLSNIEINQHNVDLSSEISENDYLFGVLRDNERVIQLIDIKKVLRTVHSIRFETKSISEKNKILKNSFQYEDGEKYLFFKIGIEMFGMKADGIREIIFHPETITKSSSNSDEIIGMATLRGQVVSIVDIAKMFDKKQQKSDQTRIIIIERDGRTVGFLVDGIVDIKNIIISQIESLPEDFYGSKLDGVFRYENQLVSLISDEYISNFISKADTFLNYETGNSTNNIRYKLDDEEQKECIIFKICEQEYGFLIDNIEEIIKLEEITKVPGVSPYISGIINLRGRVIPVISLHKRVGCFKSFDSDTKILVCKYENFSVGIIVDSVSEVININISDFKSASNDDKIIEEIVLLDNGKRTVFMFSIEEILTSNDIRKFNKVIQRVAI